MRDSFSHPARPSVASLAHAPARSGPFHGLLPRCAPLVRGRYRNRHNFKLGLKYSVRLAQLNLSSPPDALQQQHQLLVGVGGAGVGGGGGGAAVGGSWGIAGSSAGAAMAGAGGSGGAGGGGVSSVGGGSGGDAGLHAGRAAEKVTVHAPRMSMYMCV
jgi:hypothetical protein